MSSRTGSGGGPDFRAGVASPALGCGAGETLCTERKLAADGVDGGPEPTPILRPGNVSLAALSRCVLRGENASKPSAGPSAATGRYETSAGGRARFSGFAYNKCVYAERDLPMPTLVASCCWTGMLGSSVLLYRLRSWLFSQCWYRKTRQRDVADIIILLQLTSPREHHSESRIL